MKAFLANRPVEGFKACRPKQVLSYAQVVDEPFVVEERWGKENDYLVKGPDGLMYPCPKGLFDQLFEIIG